MSNQTPRREQTATDVEWHLNRAAALMGEVRDYFAMGIDTTDDNAAEQIALTQALIAAANAHTRIAEVDIAFSDWRERPWSRP